MGKAERLELVTAFEQLKVGMVVVLRNCLICGRDHRRMLISLALRRFTDGKADMSWTGVPVAHSNAAFDASAVRERRVFRVVDGLEDAKHEPRTRELSRG